jgi:hypothetical protein
MDNSYFTATLQEDSLCISYHDYAIYKGIIKKNELIDLD